VILPNKPWSTGFDQSKSRLPLVRAAEVASVAIAMVALFLVGRGLGADRSFHLVALIVALAGAAGAFALPSLALRFQRAMPAAYPAAVPYSEERLLQSWPARRGTLDALGTSGIDRFEREG
jgi:hypothetical protein